MKPTEAAALLTIAAALDNRKPDADQAKAWAMVLDGLRFEDCRDVIVQHFRTSREWMMPADVIAGVKRLRSKRVADFGPIDPPADLDPNDTDGYGRWLRDATRQIADGTYRAPTNTAEALPPRDVVKELGHVGSSAREGIAAGRMKIQAAEAEKTAARDARQAELERMRADDRAAREALATTESGAGL